MLFCLQIHVPDHIPSLLHVEMISRIICSIVFPQTEADCTVVPQIHLPFLEESGDMFHFWPSLFWFYFLLYFHFLVFFQFSRTFANHLNFAKIIRSGLTVIPSAVMDTFYQVLADGSLSIPSSIPSQGCFVAQLQLIQMIPWTEFPVPPLFSGLWTYSVAAKPLIREEPSS